MGRRTLGTLVAVAVAAAGCGLGVDAPPSVAEQVAATQPQDRKDDAPPEADTTGDDASAEAPDGAADGPTAAGAEEDELPEVPVVEPEEPAFDQAALEAACAELLASFDTVGIAQDDDAFVDVARAWRQLSLPLAEIATEAAALDPSLEAFAEATRDGSATMRTLHVAAEEGDLEAVELALSAYSAIGSRIEAEAEEHGLTGCL